jgi:spermidine synthase
MHGNILHGTQFMSDEFRGQPLTYYHRSGPIGQMMAMKQPKKGEPFDLAVIGLGTGTMSAYPEEGQSITFYEIDPLIKHISYDQDQYFTYVQDAIKRGVNMNIVLGDARLTMNRRATSHPEEKYDVIVVDAFSSDAIPVHLITQEALDVYLAKLKPDGIIAFHTSNRYLRLEPVVGNLAAKKNLAALTQHDGTEEGHPGKSSSSWVMVTRDEANFGKLLEDVKVDENDRKHNWERQVREEKLGEWTDSFENLWSVFNWSSK